MVTHDLPALGRALMLFAAVKGRFEAEQGPLAGPETTVLGPAATQSERAYRSPTDPA